MASTKQTARKSFGGKVNSKKLTARKSIGGKVNSKKLTVPEISSTKQSDSATSNSNDDATLSVIDSVQTMEDLRSIKVFRHVPSRLGVEEAVVSGTEVACRLSKPEMLSATNLISFLRVRRSSAEDKALREMVNRLRPKPSRKKATALSVLAEDDIVQIGEDLRCRASDAIDREAYLEAVLSRLPGDAAEKREMLRSGRLVIEALQTTMAGDVELRNATNNGVHIMKCVMGFQKGIIKLK